jgi:uncharacterized protein (AIM24 family)
MPAVQHDVARDRLGGVDDRRSAGVVHNAAEAPTFADTNAVVAWSAKLQTQLKTSFKAGALIGRGSGEAIQVSFYGQGSVIVQPSEGIRVTATA